jgi:sugar lactone lactonase YvrE
MRRPLSFVLALALTGCVQAGKTPVKPHTTTPTAADVVGTTGGGLISDHGTGLIANNGGGLTGKVKIPSGIIANNTGNLIANNAGSIIAGNTAGLVSDHGGGYLLLALDEKPAAGFAVTIVDAAGQPVLDASGKAYTATTDAQGGYSFEKTPAGANLVVRVELPAAVGPMLAYLPDAKPGAARAADVTGTSTLVMGYILTKYVKGDAKVLAKLPADVEADTRAKAAAAIGDTLDLKAFKPEALVPAVEGLRAKDPSFDQQVKAVEKLLVAGLADVGDGELATDVGLASPRAFVRLADGSLLIAERNGHRVRRLDPKTGRLTTFAGKDGSTAPGDGGPAVEAFIDRPVSLALDSQGNLYVADFGHATVRRVDAQTKLITTVAGNGKDSRDEATPPAFQGAVATSMPFHNTTYVAVDEHDHVVFRSGDGVFRVEADGKLTELTQGALILPDCLAKGPDGKVYGYENGSGEIHVLEGDAFKMASYPIHPGVQASHLAFDATGAAFLTDQDQLWKLPKGGSWAQVPFATTHGELTGVLPEAGGLTLGDSGNNRVWQLPAAGGDATRLAGQDGVHGDALEADKLSLNRPSSLALDPAGNLLVADGLNSVIWQRKPDGKFYRYAGGVAGTPADTEIGDGGSARDAKLLKVAGMILLSEGSLLLCEADPPVIRVREVLSDGTIETRALPEGLVAPALMAEEADGTLLVSDYLLKKVFRWRGKTATPIAIDVEMKQPGQPLARPDGSFYIPDVKGCAIYQVDQAGHATLLAGGNGEGFAGDGADPTKAQLNNPVAIAVAPNGDLYIADTRNDRVRRVHQGKLQTVAGQGGLVLAGTTPDDSLKEPLGLVFDQHGDLYIADSGHNQIKKVEAAKLQ